MNSSSAGHYGGATVKKPPVEIWMPIASGKTIDMMAMAKNGLKAIVTLNGEKIINDVVVAYHEACQKHGHNRSIPVLSTS